VKVTRTRGRGVRTSDVHAHVAQLRPEDTTAVGDIRVTSGARTVVDLGRRLPFRESLVVADGAMRARVSRRQLQDVLRHQWTWPRVRAAMLTVRHADPKAESALESVVRSRFIELGLPMPELQVNITGPFGWVARVDFDFNAYGVVGEADGRAKYTDDELWAEKLRQESLEDAGREVIRWTWARAHASDAEFAARVWRYLNRGLLLRSLREVG
jgi:very-short-patch-repair endonuclease